MTVQDHRELVAALLAVEGVAGAMIEPGAGEPGTLRLQLSPGTDEVRVAGSVNRLLRARFGLAVDSDRVRVLDEPEGGARRIERSMPEPVGAKVTGGAAPLCEDVAVRDARPSRLAIERVELVSAGLGVAVTVELSCRGRVVTGDAEGAATQTGVHRSVAVATLRAVEAVVEGKARFEVEHIELTRSGPDQTVLVVLTMVTGRSTQRLSGACVVREDVRQAVVRAVLDSVNRRMEPMLVST